MTVVRGYVDYEHGQLHYRSVGAGFPLVLLHQNPNSSVMYEAVYEPLAAHGYRVIGFDHPACGQSDPPPEPGWIADYASWLWQGVDGLGIERCHLLGHHTGAAIACEMAVTAPLRIARLVLSGAPCLDPRDRAQVEVWSVPRPLALDGSHLLQVWNQRLAATPGWTNLDVMHRGVIQSMLPGDRFAWGFRAGMAYDMPARLAQLTVPTLLITGTLEDMYQPTLRAHELRPDFPLVVFDGATRDVVDEQPAAFATAVADFLGAGGEQKATG